MKRKADDIIYRCFDQGVYWGKLATRDMEHDEGFFDQPEQPIDRTEAQKALYDDLKEAMPKKRNLDDFSGFERTAQQGQNFVIEEMEKVLKAYLNQEEEV